MFRINLSDKKTEITFPIFINKQVDISKIQSQFVFDILHSKDHHLFLSSKYATKHSLVNNKI